MVTLIVLGKAVLYAMKKNIMKKVSMCGTFEWVWIQTFICGCTAISKRLGGVRPTHKRTLMAKQRCPKCELKFLLA